MKFLIQVFLFLSVICSAQSANRFFYELSYKPKTNSSERKKILTILDIAEKKSIYQDFTYLSQDSLISSKMDAMQKSGVYTDLSTFIRKPDIPYKIIKEYPDFNQIHQEYFIEANFSYTIKPVLKWKILPEKEKIGTYEAQKASLSFGGRNWTAWFTTQIPFQDGPYKFCGLPGLIVKIEDDRQEFSWSLKGNKKIEQYNEISLAEKTLPNHDKFIHTTPEKFAKALASYKKDPLSSMRGMFTEEMVNKSFDNSGKTLAEILKEQEKAIMKIYENDNPIEVFSEN